MTIRQVQYVTSSGGSNQVACGRNSARCDFLAAIAMLTMEKPPIEAGIKRFVPCVSSSGTRLAVGFLTIQFPYRSICKVFSLVSVPLDYGWASQMDTAANRKPLAEGGGCGVWLE